MDPGAESTADYRGRLCCVMDFARCTGCTGSLVLPVQADSLVGLGFAGPLHGCTGCTGKKRVIGGYVDSLSPIGIFSISPVHPCRRFFWPPEMAQPCGLHGCTGQVHFCSLHPCNPCSAFPLVPTSTVRPGAPAAAPESGGGHRGRCGTLGVVAGRLVASSAAVFSRFALLRFAPWSAVPRRGTPWRGYFARPFFRTRGRGMALAASAWRAVSLRARSAGEARSSARSRRSRRVAASSWW